MEQLQIRNDNKMEQLQTRRDNKLEQLQMRRGNEKAREIIFPTGYYMRAYKKGDETAWCECCVNGSLGVDKISEDIFVEKMLNDKSVNPSNIFFLISPQGEIAGTVTYQYSPNENTGTIHMVGIKQEFQGMGLALPMNLYAVEKILQDGKTKIDLQTDDWRIPAIKTYLKAGFKPVYHTPDMKERWKNVIERL
jgi:mycothiol synthase